MNCCRLRAETTSLSHGKSNPLDAGPSGAICSHLGLSLVPQNRRRALLEIYTLQVLMAHCP
jgi:hypothetical protein